MRTLINLLFIPRESALESNRSTGATEGVKVPEELLEESLSNSEPDKERLMKSSKGCALYPRDYFKDRLNPVPLNS